MIMSSTPRPAPTLDSASAAHDASLVDLDDALQPTAEAGGGIELHDPGQVRRRRQHAVDGDRSRQPDADGVDGRDLGTEPRDELGDGRDELFLALRRRTPVADDDLTVAVDDDTEAFRAADVDAETERVQCVPRPRHLRPAQLLAARSLALARSHRCPTPS